MSSTTYENIADAREVHIRIRARKPGMTSITFRYDVAKEKQRCENLKANGYPVCKVTTGADI